VQSTAQVLRQLFESSRHVTDATALLEHAVRDLTALSAVRSIAVFVQQTRAPHRVRVSASHGLSADEVNALSSGAVSGFEACSVPLAATPEQVTVVCGGADAETVSLVATFLALALERDQAITDSLRLGELFSAGPVVVFRWRNAPGWPVEYVSPNVTRVLGFQLEQLLEQQYSPLVFPADLERVAGEVQEAMKHGVSYFAQQYRMFDAQAQVRDVFDFTHVIRDASGAITHFHGYVFDDGEQARSERAEGTPDQRRKPAELVGRLHQAHKLQAVGAMASGVAHDFNNVLAAILAHLELARLEPALADNPDLAAAMQAAVRGRDIVRQLLVFGRSREDERTPHRLQRIIEDSMGMMRSTMPSAVGLRLSLDPKAPPVLADPTQLQQVVVNLVTLAANAMTKKGSVEITLATRPGSPPGAELTVTSEGEVPSEREAKGLGLSVVRTIIKAHGGSIELRPTSAVVWLPGVDPSEFSGVDGLSAAAAAGKRQRIALVDDEPLVARATERLVAQFGYQVTVFTSADDVLHAFAEKSDAFELVLTDQAMPEMTGLELTHALRARGLRVPVLLVTGLPTEIDVKSVAPPFTVLGKPYRSEELATGLALLLVR
jgi:signal transduction histidine kinase